MAADVKEYYENNNNFREFVKRAAVSQEKTVEQILESAIAREVMLFYKERE